jgi:PadR family transcriptional regulator AphA
MTMFGQEVTVKKLTSTSYAVLALLSVQPFSAYGLTQQMKRSLHFVWPRAERAIYAEPKNLLAHGLVTAATETSANRRRTVYTITPAGRDRLGQWLAKPSSPPLFESEAMVRAAFSEQGSQEDLLATLVKLRNDAAALRAQASTVARSYVDGTNQFQQRIHVNALVGRFIFDYVNLLERWSVWAEAQVRDWPNTTDPSVFPGALALFRDFLSSGASDRSDVPTVQPRS